MPPPQPSLEGHSSQILTSRCAAISASDSQLAPISQLCQFAMSYRSSLPNFICGEETSSRSDWLGGPPPVLIDAQVVYQDGMEQVTEVRKQGAPPSDSEQRKRVTFQTHGEFGSELIDLFAPQAHTVFHYTKRIRMSGTDALEFSFHLPSEQMVWTVGDGKYNVRSEFQGAVWVAAGSTKILRMRLETVRLPAFFGMDSAEKQTDYGQVNLGEAGTFVLPVHARSQSCLRSPEGRPLRRCMTNSIQFHGCRKFAGRARIVGVPQ